MKKENFRVSEKLIEKIDTYVKECRISKTDIFNDALIIFFNCKTVEPSFQPRLIPIRYETSCLICGKKLEVGAWAMYARGTGAIFVDCLQRGLAIKATSENT